MPNYLFESLDGEETTELFYPMKEAPRTGDIVEIDGKQWKRIFTLPQAVTTGLKPVDPFSQKQFREKTGAMSGTVGELWDYSKEMSQRRAEKMGGDDPVKQKYFKDFRKARKGTPHTAELAESQIKTVKNANEKLKSKGIKITLNE